LATRIQLDPYHPVVYSKNEGGRETMILVVAVVVVVGVCLRLVHLKRFDPVAENHPWGFPILLIDVAAFQARYVVVVDGSVEADIRHNAIPSLDPIAYCLASSCWQVAELRGRVDMA
jgi:hypothetical protein